MASDEVMGKIAAAARYDPAVRAFELNEAGMDVFLDSISAFIITQNLDAEPGCGTRSFGHFVYPGRAAFTALNTLENGSINAIREDEVVHTFLYEVFGRGSGFGEPMSRFVAEHLGAPTHSRHETNWARNPAFEWALADVSGGAHAVIAAANRGQDYFRRFSNEMIPLMNPHFDFDYDAYRRASMITDLHSSDLDIIMQFAQATGAETWHERDRWVLDAGDHFVTATNLRASLQERR